MALTQILKLLAKETAFACNEKTLKEVNGLEWITRDSCCASANFLGKLNGLSIPHTIITVSYTHLTLPTIYSV